MNLDLSNRCALITGGSAGLGFATALEFARYGAHVIIVARNGDRLARAVDQLRTETGAQIEGFAADVTDRDAISNVCVRRSLNAVAASIFWSTTPVVRRAAQLKP